MARVGGATAWAVVLVATLCATTASLVYLQTQPPTTVVVVGPAETADHGRPNPGLSAAGIARARELVRVLGELPVSGQVAAVFATRYRDSQETAEPIARFLDLPVQLVDSTNYGRLVDRIAAAYRGRLLVVVTDFAAMPALIRGLLKGDPEGAEPGPDPSLLYVVTMPRIGAGRAVALRYGAAAGEVAGS